MVSGSIHQSTWLLFQICSDCAHWFVSIGLKHKSLGVFEWLLMVFVLVLVLSFLPFSIWFCIKVVREHERAVVFRLGHLLRGKPRGPGLLFYLPFLDVSHKVDIRLKIPELSAVCYYQIENVALCITSLFNNKLCYYSLYLIWTSQLH
uniref:Band 7 domain-containing protein n=1 Tax=Gouania willdenowi TaxID=441366 RepID=A0A8C5I2H2_GOUWI